MYPGPHSGQTGRACAVPPKSLKFSKIFASKPKVKTVAEKLRFKLRIWPGHLVMDILKSSQLVIFSHSTIFITFSYWSLAGFLFKLLRKKPEVALDFCVWPLCDPGPCATGFFFFIVKLRLWAVKKYLLAPIVYKGWCPSKFLDIVFFLW